MYKPTAQIEWAISGIIIGVILWIFFAVPFYFPLTVIAMAIAVPTAYLILTPMSSLRSQHAERQMRHRRLHKRLKSLKRRISS
jgi:ABC-type multidrug transport system permease subunit